VSDFADDDELCSFRKAVLGAYLASKAPVLDRAEGIDGRARVCARFGASAGVVIGAVGGRIGLEVESRRIDVGHSERTTASRHVSGTIRQALL
jgi:hypothetical protein